MSAETDVVTRGGAHSRARGRTIDFNFVPALDGLRAIAVLGVLLYHGGAPLVTGGFLGVNVFFVLSGFLITTLLLGEWATRLSIRLGEFWARRARRLLPALLLMLLGVAILAKVFAASGEFASLRLDALSTLFYVANWHFIIGGANYFIATAQPSPLGHMWSLAIEEQFYIVWPPVVLVLLRLGQRLRPSRRLWPVLTAAVAGALASALDMRISFLHGASLTRLYEGTDTRSQDILVGAALAIAMAIWAEHRTVIPSAIPELTAGRFGRAHPSAGTTGTATPRPHRRDLHRRRGPSIRPINAWEITGPLVRPAIQTLGWSALLVGLVFWTRVDSPTAFLFEGGELLFALGVAAVIFSTVTAQTATLSRSLGNPVFRYVGKISYGIYLWHYPLFAVLDAARMHLYGLPLLAVRLAVTLLVATASYYLVEMPIRRGRMASLTEWRAWLATSAAFLGVVAVTVATTVPAAAGPVEPVRVVGTGYTGEPVKVAVFGDSVAWRLGFALLADQPQQRYDVSIENGAIVACGVLRSTEYEAGGVTDVMVPPCNSSSPPSAQWPAQWKDDLDQFRPNVVMILAGRWEVMNRLIDGRWVHIGEPAFDSVLHQSLEQAVQVASSDGALVVLMTAPCFDSGEQPNGQPWPEDSSARLSLYNQMVRQVAAEHPATVRLEDFGALVCPGGVFSTSIDGVQLRDGDGVHIVPTPAAGQWLAGHLLPSVIQVGRLQMAGHSLLAPPTGSTVPSPPVTVSASGTTSAGGGGHGP